MPQSSLFAPLPIDSVGRGKKVVAAVWSHEPALLAVALEGGTVLVLDEDGSLYGEVVRGRQSQPDLEARGSGGTYATVTVMTWSSAPLKDSMLLAIGWNDGSVMVWSEKERMQRSDDEQHSGQPISVLLFSPANDKLLSGDRRPVGSAGRPQDSAVLCTWKVDNKGRISCIVPHKKPAVGGITHCLFRTADVKKKLTTSMFAAAEMPSFWFGGETGTICMGDDMGCVPTPRRRRRRMIRRSPRARPPAPPPPAHRKSAAACARWRPSRKSHPYAHAPDATTAARARQSRR